MLKLLVILGPTASGKSDAAIKIAREFNGEIIAADSRTIYREMNIGTAKPVRDGSISNSFEEVKEKGIAGLFDPEYLVDEIPHWGIGIADVNQDFTVADYKEYTDKKIEEISARGNLPMLVGGTGLYISAVVDNMTMTSIPPDPAWREAQKDILDEELINRLRELDPVARDTIDTSNRRRLLRALEIVEKTGKPLADAQRKGEPKYDTLIIGITRDREELYERIDHRVDKMVAEGLVDEVRALKEKYGVEVNAMTGIGYRQICAFLTGYLKLRDAVELIKRDSRHYAKRQITWFKRDERIKWLETDKIEDEVNVWINK
jgi:tRNA dimethylallyltransferase